MSNAVSFNRIASSAEALPPKASRYRWRIVVQCPKLRGWQVASGAVVVIGGLIGLQALLTANQHPYRSLDHYLEKRQTELHAASHMLGPEAKVGWQDARWIRWTLPDGAAKYELIKLDRQGRPTLERAEAAAKKYQGPSGQEVDR